jgi:hypothetical protein
MLLNTSFKGIVSRECGRDVAYHFFSCELCTELSVLIGLSFEQDI